MEKLVTIAQVIMPIFISVFLGMCARKKAVLSPEGVQGLQQFVVKFCLPCLIFQSCLTADFGAQNVSSIALLLPFLLLSTLWAFWRGRKRYPHHNLPMLFCCKETGMIGIPLFMILFGADQAYHMGLLDLLQALIGFPVIGILSADTGAATAPGQIVKQMLRSPLILLSILGITLNLSGAWDLFAAAGLGGIVTETLTFISQPISTVMLFCVGYNFSLAKDNRMEILQISALHLAIFVTMGLVIQLILSFMPGVGTLTRWSLLIYSILPCSYLAPGLGRSEGDSTVASGACSMLTVICLLAFFCMAIIVS